MILAWSCIKASCFNRVLYAVCTEARGLVYFLLKWALFWSQCWIPTLQEEICKRLRGGRNLYDVPFRQLLYALSRCVPELIPHEWVVNPTNHGIFRCLESYLCLSLLNVTSMLLWTYCPLSSILQWTVIHNFSVLSFSTTLSSSALMLSD